MPESTEPTWVRHGAEALAEVERRSRRLRGYHSQGCGWRRSGRLVAAADFDVGLLPVTPGGVPWDPVTGLPQLTAEAFLLSSMPGKQLRLRAFYTEIGLTASVHEVQLLARSALTRGAAVARRMNAPDGLVIPAQVEAKRWGRRAWVVEEFLAGKPVRRVDWPSVAPDVAVAVGELWRQSAPEAVPVARALPGVSTDRVTQSLRAMELEPSKSLLQRIDSLLQSSEHLLAGISHGDPSPNNVLKLADCRLGLVDWERAGRHLLGLDVCRLLAALDDPAPVIPILADGMRDLGISGVHAAELQGAAAMLTLVPTWAKQGPAWRIAGRGRDYGLRNERRLSLLEHLLEA